MQTRTESINVLHVDDEPDLADVVSTFLEREDDRLTVETATNASEGLEMLAENEYDCVVSDFDMPGKDGIEFLESIREEYPDLPFILYTGKGSEAVASDAISAGVTDYLQKEGGTGQYAVLANRVANAVEKYHTEREFAKRQEQLNLFFEQSPLGVIQWDESVSLSRLNDKAEEILGYDEADLEGNSWDAIVPESDQDDVDEVVTALLADEGGYYSLNENVRADGERIVCEWHNRVITDDAGDVVAVFSQFQDVTEREQREQAVRRERDRRRALFENAPVPVIAGSIEGDDVHRIIDVNDAFEEVFGFEQESVVGNDVADVVVPEPHRGAHQEFRERSVAGEATIQEVERTTADGPTSFLMTIIPYGIEELPADGWYAWYTDISEQKERQRVIAELHRTSDELIGATSPEEVAGVTVEAIRDILDMPINAVHLYDEDVDRLVPVDWTAEAEDLVDTPPEFEVGEGIAGQAYESGEPKIYEDVSEVPERYNPDTEVRSHIILPLADHGILIIGSTEVDAFDEMDVSLAGTVASHVTSALDRIERETELVHREKLLEAVLETSTDGILVVDDDREIITWNQQFLDLWDLSEAAIEHQTDEFALKRRVDELESPSEFIETIEYLYDHPHEESWDRIRFTDGRVFDRYTAPVEAEDGTYFGRVWFFRDITAEETREQELAEQNERLNEFTSVVSHDLRNPLDVASGRVELAREECDSEHLAHAADALDRSFALIDDLLTLASEGQRPADLSPVNLGEVCENCWHNVETDNTTLVADTDQSLLASQSRFKQLLENLFRNAVEHAGADVTVTIGALPDGFYVADDGEGIPVDRREQVFDTGYSSRPRGTGFGLSIVRQVADRHGWNVAVTESADGGARFEFTGIEMA